MSEQPHLDSHYLQEMGIQSYDLAHPERLKGFESPSIELAADCQLLLVSSELPLGDTALFLEKVLKAMKLSLDSVLHIYPHQYQQVNCESLDWLWFAGCDAQTTASTYVLSSPLLSEIDGNTEARRALWQQIQSRK